MRGLLLSVALLIAAPAARATYASPPAEARARKDAGDAARRSGDAAAAIAAYREAIAVDPRYAEAYAAMGDAQYAARAYPAAAESFARAVEIDPGYAVAWYNLAFVSRRAGALERARDAFVRYVALVPADPDGHLALAETLRGLGDSAGAIREYQAFVDLARAAPEREAAVAQARVALAALGPSASAPSAARPSATALFQPASAAVAAPPAAAHPGVADKLVLGDRLFASGDHRGALFAYQDAVYLDPKNAAARVKLGRAYAALRYPEQASAQFAQAVAIDPANEEARRAMDEARNPPPARPPAAPIPTVSRVATATPAPTSPKAPPSPTAPAPTSTAAAAATATATRMSTSTPMPRNGSASQARVYRLPEEPPAEEPVAAPRPVGPDSEPTVDVTVAAQPAAPAQPPPPTAGQRYRAALELVARREYAKAIGELNEAILLDPRLAVAYAARASAQFGLGKVREAAEDYRAALGLAPEMATPLYGLGECHRLLGDPAQAADYYGRYSESHAPDAREELREVARRRVAELGSR